MDNCETIPPVNYGKPISSRTSFKATIHQKIQTDWFFHFKGKWGMLAILFGNIMTPVFGASYERMYLLQVVIPLFVDATICFFLGKIRSKFPCANAEQPKRFKVAITSSILRWIYWRKGGGNINLGSPIPGVFSGYLLKWLWPHLSPNWQESKEGQGHLWNMHLFWVCFFAMHPPFRIIMISGTSAF